ncbi:MAG: O-antigen ligase family protein [Oscillospiraceae bacterium]|nr:O-antigen ligase family protein [Oscillospiraceae bacterium]
MAKAETKPAQRPALPLETLLLLAPFFFGCYYPWVSALASLCLLSLLFLWQRAGPLAFRASPLLFTTVSIVLFHLLGTLWGVDRGMAPVGAVKFLPLPLLVLALDQFRPEERMRLFRRLPYAACVMVILSLLLSLVPALKAWFIINSRQAGFFQYPNTYALYLLVAVAVVLFGEPLRFGPLPYLAVLLAGIALSGSRTVFVLLIPVLVFACIWEKDKKRKTQLAGFFAALLVLGTAAVVLTGDRATLGRFLTISLESSEFLGRLLYARDALPVILRHPFGLGYLGYSWLQGSFQTGVYAVRHVHNELLQLLLDAGWIPAVLFVISFVRAFRVPRNRLLRSVLLTVIGLHCLLDFDTQFVSVALLLFLVMDTEPQSGKTGKAGTTAAAAGVLLGLFTLYFGAADFTSFCGKPEAAVKLYPGYTSALVDLLPKAQTAEELDAIADRILRVDGSVALAHSAKSRTAFSQGKFNAAVQEKEEAIRLAKYTRAEYLDYFDMLEEAYGIYTAAGEEASAAFCLEKMAAIPRMLRETEAGTSRLGRAILDQPDLDFPEEYQARLDRLTGK